jgi:membrane-bound lytic murein transglycosylase B|tara:strand:+ start:809 stop:1843 length:1035 start_codon:yes stop_codon:yes gene_type:complete
MNFNEFLEKEALSFKDKVIFNKEVLFQDGNQTQHLLSLQKYLEKTVTKTRVDAGKEKLKIWENQLKKIQKDWGVPPEVIIAIWGIETNFGEILGEYRVVDSLATLAFGAREKRRRVFFKSELLALETIKNEIGIEVESLLGSWAGAFGHTQFMPTTYLKFSAPFEIKKVPNIWNKENPLDALSSTACYLMNSGWSREGFILKNVPKPKSLDYLKTGINLTEEMGFTAPFGYSGPHFKFGKNASAIFHYNRSEFYVFSVWVLSSALQGSPQKIVWPKDRGQINSSEISVMQERLTLLGYDTLGVDGKLGLNTKKALIAFQKAIGQRPDGYPDRLTFNRLLTHPSP